MTDTATDPKQAEVDRAVAAMVASNPAILTGGPFAAEPISERLAGETFPPSPELVTVPSGAVFPERNVSTGPNGAVPERLRLALARRSAFRAAMAGLRTRGTADEGPIRTALANASKDGIVTAIVQHAVGLFLDSECGRPYTFLHGLSAQLETEVVTAIYAAPRQILETLPDDGSAEVAYIRRTAVAASTLNEYVFDSQGQPSAPKPPSLSLFVTLVPR